MTLAHTLAGTSDADLTVIGGRVRGRDRCRRRGRDRARDRAPPPRRRLPRARTASRAAFGLSTPDPDEAAVKAAIVARAPRGRRRRRGQTRQRAAGQLRARWMPSTSLVTDAAPGRRTRGRARPTPKWRCGSHEQIVTLTANPSLDRTITLAAALQPGEVQAGGVCPRGCRGQGNQRRAGRRRGRRRRRSPSCRSADDDPVLRRARARRACPHGPFPLTGHVRANLTITDPAA